MQFLTGRIIESDIKRVFFVINHKDVLRTPEKMEKVFNYAKTELEKVIDAPRIFLVSSKYALQARRENHVEICLCQKYLLFG